MPVYNVGKYIEECLISVIAQSYTNIELLLVNDGTKDNSVELAEKVLSNWEGDYKIIHQKNSGACAARNNALSLASGQYIMHLDADDKIGKNLIKEQIEALRTKSFDPSIIAVCKWVGLEDKSVCMSNLICHNYTTPSDLLVDMYINHVCIYPHCYMVPRELVEKGGLWDTNLVQDEDGDFFARIIVNASSIIYNSTSTAYYRFGNMTSQSKEISLKAINGFVDTAIKKSNLLLAYSKNTNVKDAVYELVTLKPKTYYPYFREVRHKAEEYIKSTIGRDVVYPKCSLKERIYYILVCLGLKKSNLKS